ncbi:MAG: hypothetical protein QOE84_1413, partial [Actinomycetota bacterium]|nr:hypothetical protein [Actinomycetota bacterium]
MSDGGPPNDNVCVLALVREHLIGPPVGSSLTATVAGHLHRGTPKVAAASLGSGEDPTTVALRQLVTFHDQAWFPGGFAADASPDVLAVVHRDAQETGADPSVAAAVELVTRSGGWRFLVIGSSRVSAEKGAAAAE